MNSQEWMKELYAEIQTYPPLAECDFNQKLMKSQLITAWSSLEQRDQLYITEDLVRQLLRNSNAW